MTFCDSASAWIIYCLTSSVAIALYAFLSERILFLLCRSDEPKGIRSQLQLHQCLLWMKVAQTYNERKPTWHHPSEEANFSSCSEKLHQVSLTFSVCPDCTILSAPRTFHHSPVHSCSVLQGRGVWVVVEKFVVRLQLVSNRISGECILSFLCRKKISQDNLATSSALKSDVTKNSSEQLALFIIHLRNCP